MVTLILLLNASGLALEWPSLMVLGMSSLRLRIFLHSSTISGMRLWEARKIYRFSLAPACPVGWCGSVLGSSLSCHDR